MKQLFVSYAREDLARAEPIVDGLRRAGFQVFWDQSLPAGVIWRDFLDAQLGSAYRLVVLWSKTSVASRWVRDEADEALQRGKLLPVLLDDVRPPLGFREVHCFDLIGWDGESGDPRLARLAGELRGSRAGSGDAQDPEPPPPPPPPGWRRPLLIGAASVALLWLAFTGWQRFGGGGVDGPLPAASSAFGPGHAGSAAVPPDDKPSTPNTDADAQRCAAITGQIALGNPISEADRAFLRAGCR